MGVRGFLEPIVLRCPNCESTGDCEFAGIQKGYGYGLDFELWTCRRCHSTFSEKSLGVKDEIICEPLNIQQS
ncbi:MAG TPA: hypothetical protein ACFYD3_06445 [Candidatus Hypogeohydataceae bacterium YC41]